MKTVKALMELYERTAVEMNRALKDSTKQYYAESLKFGLLAWPGLAEKDIATVTRMEAAEWASGLNYSPSRFNGITQQFRAMFQLAIELGLRTDNPMGAVKRMPVRIKPPALPTNEQFKQMLAALDCEAQAGDAAKFVRFLAFSGRRIGEVRKMTREDITEQGIRALDTKNGETIYGPILPEMRTLLKSLPASGPLFNIKNPRRALRTACRRIGIARLTNHMLRHIFASRAIECGVDVPTVAAWLGHKDGGALALKRYNHVRNDHSKAMAETVRFGTVRTKR